ncbi:MAG: diguanylate cyclase [Deltaproteobacteria bacterium]|nr:diguanylate cyclase [Deltaproteobacteria bacterium]
MGNPELNRIRIVVADDQEDNARVIEETLKNEGYQVRVAGDGEAALRLVKTWSPQLVLLDINMPKLTGMEVLVAVRALSGGEYVGVILVTANSGLDEVVGGLDAGADDYIVKPFRMPELRARVRACLRTKNLHDSLRRANRRLEELASRDELTMFFNMRFAGQRLADEVAAVRRSRRPISCLMFDMDHFKGINDRFGHLVGSQVLREVAKLVTPFLRTTDVPARYGGDEFLIAMPDTRLKEAAELAERMRKKIESHVFSVDVANATATASFGVAGVDDPQILAALDANALVRAADAALYAAKNGGRNRVEQLGPK